MREFLFFLFLFVHFNSSPLFAQHFNWTRQNSNSTASLRGLAVVNDTVVWASGSGGTILRTLNGGMQWEKLPAPSDSLDFRSLWVFNAQEALIASAGQPARIYRTGDGGRHWQLVYADTTGKAFFDAISFWDPLRGLALSDPIEGKILLLQTQDGGWNWSPIALPAAEKEEAFFAASNASIAMAAPEKVWIGTGGGAIRVLHSPDGGERWQIQAIPLQRKSAASGLYALSFATEQQGVAVGGAYDQPEEGSQAAVYTRNGGKRWHLPQTAPRGYRSGLAHLPGTSTYISVGTRGTDVSRDGGKNWSALNDENLNSIRFSPAGRRAWAVGAQGAVFVIDVTAEKD
ncbi:oxidoreductase [Cesiribacter sp. SM1]|uniref:WD40/YVTN/BNR-like repeat-containing protein n=1 Tax=Cesiribacter sp. SM1 TaxID=2861196 RepID=UPI001CD255C5|nr:oxidoreductase [Cesiribacter sp. SM1]